MTTAAPTTPELASPKYSAAGQIRARLVATIRRRWFGLSMAAIIAVGISLRWVRLSFDSIWFDEGMTAWLASLPVPRMARTIAGDVAAPAYFAALHVWVMRFGDSVVSLRAFSALPATLNLLPICWLMRRCVRGRLATTASLLLWAANYLQIEYAHEARYYAWLSLLLTTALTAACAAAERASETAVIAVALCCAISLYTHSAAAFYLPTIGIAWLLWPGERPKHARVVDGLVAFAIIAFLYSPWVPVLHRQMAWMAGSFWATKPTPGDAAITSASIVGVWAYDLPSLAWRIAGHTAGVEAASAAIVCIALLGMLLAGMTRDRPQRRRAAVLLAFVLLPPAIIFIYSQRRQPIFIERLFVPSAALVPVLLAMGASVGRSRGARVAAVSIAAGLLAFGGYSAAHLLGEPRKEDWRGAYAWLSRQGAGDGRLLVFVANEGQLPLLYYAQHDPARSNVAQRLHGMVAADESHTPFHDAFATLSPERWTGTPQGFFDLDPPQTIRRVMTDADLDKLRTQLASPSIRDVILVLSHDAFADPDGRTERLMRSTWTLTASQAFPAAGSRPLIRLLRFQRW